MARARIVGWCALWLAVLMALLLVGPPLSYGQQSLYCVRSFRFTDWLRLIVVCDTGDYVALAAEPWGLLDIDSARQSRPGFVALAYLLSVVWRWPGALVSGLLPSDLGEMPGTAERIAFALSHWVAGYLAYISLNVAVLLAAVWGSLRLLPSKIGAAVPVILICILALLLANDVVKAFVWSAHTQMFNIAIPVLTIGLILHPLAPSRAAWAAMGLGLAMLIYASFALGFAGMLVGLWRIRPGWHRLMTYCVMFVLPSAAWAAVVWWVNGTYHVAEMSQYGEFVWIARSWQQGPAAFALAALDNAWFFLAAAAAQAVPALLVLLYAAIRARRLPAEATLAAGAVCLLALGFFTLIGWHAERLSITAVVPVVWLAARVVAEAKTAWTWTDAAVIGAVAFGQSMVMIAKSGPLS